MSAPGRIPWLAILLLSCAFVPAAASGAAGVATEGPAIGTPAQAPDPSRDERQMRSDLRELARAWADGGGTFGFPFWEKAGQRWRTHQITSTMYREYVTGYRDRLIVGCELLDSMDVQTDAGGDVRDLLLDSCSRRVDGLRAQQRWLDDLILRDDATAPEDVDAIEQRIADHQTQARDALQRSWRDTRLAMDLAQSRLDDAGFQRLDEDAFL